MDGRTPADRAEAGRRVAPFAGAGATRWVESDWTADADTLRRRILAGPPRIGA